MCGEVGTTPKVTSASGDSSATAKPSLERGLEGRDRVHDLVGGHHRDDGVRVAGREHGGGPGDRVERVATLGLAEDVLPPAARAGPRPRRRRSRAPVQTRTFAAGTRPSTRSYARRSRLLPPTTLSSCFGMSWRDSGQSRLPEPPATIST